MARPLDRDLRALLYSEEEARRRLQILTWRRIYLPLLVGLACVAGLAVFAGVSNAGGLSALAGASAVYLAIIGIVTGVAFIAASVYLAGVAQDLSDAVLRWTGRARGISALALFRLRTASNAIAQALIRIGGYSAAAEASYRVLSETAYSAWATITRKHYG